MDPITAVGLVASIVQLADAAFKMVGMVNTIKGGGKQRVRLLTELTSLWMVLKLVEGHFESDADGDNNASGGDLDSDNKPPSDAWVETIAVLDHDGGLFDQIHAVLDQLSDRLTPRTGHRKLVQTLRWPFDKTEVDELAQALERHKSSVSLALTSSNAAVTREIQSSAKYLKEAAANEEVKAIMDWLSSSHFLKQQNLLYQEAREGTGQWFLDRPLFEQWVNEKENTMWCPGNPGAGKTFLASIIFEHLKRSQDKTTAVFIVYCSYNDPKTQTVDGLVAALVKQLVQVTGEVSKEMKAKYHECLRLDVSPSLADLTALFRAGIQKFSRCFIIVDALDEIQEESSRRKLLQTLISDHVNVLITSRPLESIGDLFGNYDNTYCDNCGEEPLRYLYHCKSCQGSGFDLCEACHAKKDLGVITCPGATAGDRSHYLVRRFGARTIAIAATETDLRNYVSWRISNDARTLDCVRKKDDLGEKIALSIVQQARGMFLLARLHMDSLSTKRTPKALEKALEELPSELEDTYRQALARIEGTNDDDRKLVMDFLLWVTLAERYLKVHEIEHAVCLTADSTSIDPDEVLSAADLTSMCAGLVVIDASDNVRFVHYSTLDYFDSHMTQLFPEGHIQLARRCLAYLSFDAFGDGPCRGANESEDYKERTLNFPLLEYCCAYWPGHACAASEEEQSSLTDRVLRFVYDEARLASAVQAIWYSEEEEPGDWDLKSGLRPLHLAAYSGLTKVVLKILEEGCDIDCQDPLGTTALMYAVMTGSYDNAKLLLEKGADPNLTCNRSCAALHRALDRDDAKLLSLLLDQPNIDLEIHDTRYASLTPLAHAAFYNHEALIPLLLAKPGINVNARSDIQNATALGLSASQGSLEGVNAILSHPDVDVNAKSTLGTPLFEAAEIGAVEVCEALLQHGADPNIQGGDDDDPNGTALNRACDYGKVAIVQLLLENGADSSILDNQFRSVIHSAAVNGQHEVLQVLFKNRVLEFVNIDAQGRNGRTALHDAAFFNYCKTIEVLCAHGSRTDIKDNAGRSPLGVARDKDNREALEVLTRLRKQEQIRDETGGQHLRHTPSSLESPAGSYQKEEIAFMLAVRRGDLAEVQGFVAKAEKDPSALDVLNTADLDWHGALHTAVAERDEAILTLLANSPGIDLDVLDRWQRSPLYWCSMAAYHRGVKIILYASQGKPLDDDKSPRNGDEEEESDEHKHADPPPLQVQPRNKQPLNSLNFADRYGQTPLMNSLMTRQYAIAALLLENGATLTMQEESAPPSGNCYGATTPHEHRPRAGSTPPPPQPPTSSSSIATATAVAAAKPSPRPVLDIKLAHGVAASASGSAARPPPLHATDMASLPQRSYLRRVPTATTASPLWDVGNAKKCDAGRLQTALCATAQYGTAGTLRMLVEKYGADPRKKELGRSAYHFASAAGNDETMREVLRLCEET